MPNPLNRNAGFLTTTWRGVYGRVRGTVTSAIVWTCVATFVSVFLLDRLGVVSERQVVYLFGLSYDGVVRHLWLHQFITAALLHGNLTHLLFNMLTLWMLGPAVEAALGRGRYLFFSFFCAACGFAGFLLFSRGGGSIAIGYSGAIFGILVAQAVFAPNSRLYFFGLFPLRMKYAVLIFGAIELYMTVSPGGDGVAHAAHLFGALGAFLYLKLPSLWGSRWRAATPFVPAASAAPIRERTARDWGRPGEVIAEAITAIGNGNYDDARQGLSRTQFPWRAKSVVGKVKQLAASAERYAATSDERARLRLERMTLALWHKLARIEIYVAMPALSNLGLQYGERVVPMTMAFLCSSKSSHMPTSIREAMEVTLGEAGGTVLDKILPQLADTATEPGSVTQLLNLLPALSLQKHTSELMKYYGQAGVQGRECLATRLARLKDNAPGALCDLLAGCMNRLPPDLRLARDLQAKIGTRDLEHISSRWAAGGHRGAQVVLQRMYD